MGIKVKAIERNVAFEKGKQKWAFVMQAELYSQLNATKVIEEAAVRSGLPKAVINAGWSAIGEVIAAWATEGHSVAVPGLGSLRFGLNSTAVEDVNKVSANLSTREATEVRKLLDTDEGPRADTSLEGLARLRPVFAAKGSVTAGNSSQMSDGAGALLVVSEEVLKRYNLTPIARYEGFAVRGVPPEIMGIGPKEAIPAVLKSSGKSLADMKWIELNEAFAAQSLAVIRDLDLDTSIVNPNGGAIALGHPLGATGAIRAATAIHGLRERGEKGYAMVTMCIGTGMGAAGLIEVL